MLITQTSLILSIFFCQSHTHTCTHAHTRAHTRTSCPLLNITQPLVPTPLHSLSHTASSLSVHALSPPRLRCSGQRPHLTFFCIPRDPTRADPEWGLLTLQHRMLTGSYPRPELPQQIKKRILQCPLHFP